MSIVVQLKRGSTPVVQVYTGPAGELVYDRGNQSIRIHDGLKVGGHMVGIAHGDPYRPRLVSPADGASIAGSDIAVTTTPFEGLGESNVVRYQVSRFVDFAVMFFDTGWVVDDGNTVLSLGPNDQYYIRTQQAGTLGHTTQWSVPIRVTTGSGWLTYFEVDAQTSASTEMSRTTMFYTHVEGFRETYEGAIVRNTSAIVDHDGGSLLSERSIVSIEELYGIHIFSPALNQHMHIFDVPDNIDMYYGYETEIETVLQSGHNTQTFDPEIAQEEQRSTIYNGVTYFETRRETSIYTEGT